MAKPRKPAHLTQPEPSSTIRGVPTAPLIRIEAEAKSIVERESQERAMDQKEIISRLIRWFSSRDPAIKGVILGQSRSKDVANFKELVLQAFDIS